MVVIDNDVGRLLIETVFINETLDKEISVPEAIPDNRL